MTEDQVAVIISGAMKTLLELGVPALEIAEHLAAAAAALAVDKDTESEVRQELRAHFARHLEIMEGHA